MHKKLLVTGLAVCMLASTSALAGGLDVQLNLGGPPVYAAPAPVYMAPPAPVYVSPYPTYYDPHHRWHDARYWHDHRHDHDHR